MKEKLSKLKDWLVFALSFEINIILTLILFNVNIWSSIWQVARLNIAVLFFYGWLWFIDLYLNNYSTAAIEEKRRAAKEAALSQPKVAEPQPQPVVQVQPVVQPQPVMQPQPVVQPKPEPIIEPKPEPVIEPAPAPVVEPQPEPVLEVEDLPKPASREDLMAWIEEDKEEN